MVRYDAIVVGAGQAGPGVAAALAAEGRHVAMAESDRVGGTCVNHGCRPTKALRASARVAHLARRAGEYGIQTGDVTVDFEAVMARMRRMIDEMREGIEDWLTGEENIDLFVGPATLDASPYGVHRVHVDGQVLESERVYLDLGARALVPPIDGLGRVDYLTEVELLTLDALPEHLVVIGGSYIGLEFGQMFRRFGADVTIIAGGGVAGREDPDISQAIGDILRAEDIRIVEGRTTQVTPHDEGVAVQVNHGSYVKGSHLLVATGRVPNSDTIGASDLETDSHGYIKVNGRFETSVPGIWALGDVNGRGAFTHTAYHDTAILLDEFRTVDDRITAYAMFIDPPLGRVGITEAEARASGRRVLKGELPMSRVSRATLDGETDGLMKVLVDADSEEILGGAFLGLHGDDLAQLIGAAMQGGVRYPALRNSLPIHPTIAEFIPTLLGALKPLN